jgi:hypothetical protein
MTQPAESEDLRAPAERAAYQILDILARLTLRERVAVLAALQIALGEPEIDGFRL